MASTSCWWECCVLVEALFDFLQEPFSTVVAASAARWRGAMSTRALLRRLGMETYAYGLEDGGYAWAEDLRGLTVDELARWGVQERRDAWAVVDVLAMRVR